MFRHLAALLAFAAGTVLAGPIQPLADINRTVNTRVGDEIVPFGSQWLMTLCAQGACYPGITDGTPGGTHGLHPPAAGDLSWSAPPPSFAVAAGHAFFLSVSGFATSLYVSDGTVAGTTKLAGVPLDCCGPRSIVGLDTVALVAAADGLWKTDGTQAGTSRLASFAGIDTMVRVGNKVFFAATNAANGLELWTSDGTLAGTTLVRDILPGPDGSRIRGLAAVGNRAFFWAQGNYFNAVTLWVSDGTAAGTFDVGGDLAPGSMSAIRELNGKAYVLVTDATSNHLGLVQSDGTAPGTLLMQTWSGYYYSPLDLVPANGALYFAASDANDSELWKTDGTISGTVRVSNLQTYTGPAQIVGTPLAVYFTAYDGSATRTYKSGGTEATTAPFGKPGLSPVRAIGDRVMLQDGTHAYFSDGTDGGTVPVTTGAGEFNNGSYCAGGGTVLGSVAIFPADDGIHGCEIWASDGTTAGTTLLADAVPGPERSWFDSGNTGIATFARIGSTAYFLAGTSSQLDLWQTDGTPAGTRRAVSMAGVGFPYRLVGAAGGYVYFVGYAAASFNAGLWRSDGTAAGTTLVHPFNEWAITAFTPLNGAMYFATSGSTGTTLWRTDGTGTGAASVFTDTSLTYASVQVVAGASRLFVFVQPTGYASSGALYRTDGTAAGSSRMALSAITAANPVTRIIGAAGDALYFEALPPASSGQQGWAVWRTDGTDAGTTYGIGGSFAYGSTGTLVGGDLYLSGVSYFSYGYRLFKVDGAGAVDLTANAPFNGPVSGIVGSGPMAYFIASNAAGGELWMTAGTAGTTSMVQDYTPGPTATVNDSSPALMLLPNSLVFFGGGQVGEPLVFTFDTTPDPVSFAPIANVASGGTAVSAPTQVLGITQPVPVISTNGQFCVSSAAACSCDVAGYASTGQVMNGQYLCVRQSTPTTPSTTTTTFISIAGVASTFTTTTGPPRTISLSFAGTGAGRITTPAGTVNCATACTFDVPSGATVVLEAVRARGAVFSGWSGGTCSGIGPCTFVASANVAATASFNQTQRRIDPVDFDGDGRGDLPWFSGIMGGVWLMQGMSPRVTAPLYPPGTLSIPVLQADFDGDGRTDILWRSGDGRYDITFMDGANVRSTAMVTAGIAGWDVVSTGDFNGDGKADLVWKHTSGAYGAWLMDGAVATAYAALTGPTASAVIALVADFDGDGKSDLLWKRADGGYDIALLDGTSVKATKAMLGANTGWSMVGRGDFNGDGKMDLVWAHTDGSNGLWLIDGTSILNATALLGPATGWSLSGVGDLNGDGRSDLVWTHANGTVMAWLMNGISGTASAQLLTPASGWSVIGLRDVDGDGKDDILWRHADGSYAIWLMDGLAALNYRVILQGGTGWQLLP